MNPRAGVSEWMTVTQERINSFADATSDHQWLHVDPERAARESPYGATVAHGFLTLSLISSLLGTLEHNGKMAVNYGLNKVRFLRPVIAGSQIRARFDPIKVEDKPDSQKVTWKVTVETDTAGSAPAACCVIEWIVVYYK
jgi:acyl dehydratase